MLLQRKKSCERLLCWQPDNIAGVRLPPLPGTGSSEVSQIRDHRSTGSQLPALSLASCLNLQLASVHRVLSGRAGE